MESPVLRVAESLTLPRDTVTETAAVLGVRGTGKTNTAAVIAEELLRQHDQILVIDPTDVWWGLKAPKGDRGKGFPICVLGGLHGDLALAAGDGKTIADFLVDSGASLICSLTHFESQRDERRFVTDLTRRLYYRKGQQQTKTPLMVIIDEASRLVPQRVMGEDAACVGAIQQLVRQGRSRGFGVILVDQRPATINKDVLTQVELLVCHRTSSPQDRKALEAWIEQHDAAGHRQKFLETLPTLPVGTAWFWSPGWLDVFQQVKVRPRDTYDSSATPKPGQTLAAPARVATVDVDALKAQLATSIEKARADDPAELKKQIAALKRELATKKGSTSAPAKPVIDETAIARAVDRAVGHLRREHERRQEQRSRRLTIVRKHLGELVKAIEAIIEDDNLPAPEPQLPAAPSAPVSKPAPVAARKAPPPSLIVVDNGEPISRPQSRILATLRELEQLGVAPVRRAVCGWLSGSSHSSSSFEKNLGALRTRGFIDYPEQGTLVLTEAGRAIAPGVDAPASLEELHARMFAHLSAPQGRIVRALFDARPEALSRDDLSDRAEAAGSSSSFEKNLGALRTLGIIDYPTKGYVVATNLLFPDNLT